jgi:hypothetical protein
MLGDHPGAVPQLMRAGVDYLVMDYLAELTLSLLARGKAKRPDAGYARLFTEHIWRDNVVELAERGVKLVTNAGGLNPRACRDRMEEIASAAGVELTIAVVDGDDIRGRLDALAGNGALVGMNGDQLPKADAIMSANVYLGAQPIVAALAAGADVVITGRVVDSALALAPLVYEFGWGDTDYDLLSAGSLAGHVIECGAQATGGLFTDWESVEDWAHIGYPILECRADGSFVVTKAEGTGGYCSAATVSEQMLYEVGDTQAYVLPDVVCDFSRVEIEDMGPDRVQVRGAVGRAAPLAYKTCVTYTDGWRAIVLVPVVGMAAPRKAQRQAEAMLQRHAETLGARGLAPLRATRIEILGAEATYGRRARAVETREVICKIGIEHDEREAVDLFLNEVNAHTTSMSVGSTGWFGGPPSSSPVVRVASFVLPREEVPAQVSVGEKEWRVDAGAPEAAVEIVRPSFPSLETGDRSEWVDVPLVRLAHGRSGDKGNNFNVGIVARERAYLPYIREALTTEAVAGFFADDFDDAGNARVDRFDLVGIPALNFLCHDALGGGQMASLRLDPLGKGKAQQLLEFAIPVPPGLAAGLPAAPF